MSRRSPNVTQLINRVPSYLKNDPDLIYERMRWRRKAKLDTASEFLLNPPSEISNVRGWWINSRIVVRRLLNKKKYEKAYTILSKNILPITSDSGLSLEGWQDGLRLVFLQENKQLLNTLKKSTKLAEIITRLKLLFG